MEVIECKHNVKCELGACKNRATRAVKFDRFFIRGVIFAWYSCVNLLYTAIGAAVVPKSVETARKKRAKDGGQ